VVVADEAPDWMCGWAATQIGGRGSSPDRRWWAEARSVCSETV